MSSNIEVQKICEECGTEFTARTTVTRYCCHSCNGKAYKRKLSQSKVKQATSLTLQTKLQDIDRVKAKEILSIPDVALLIGCSKRTAYRLISSGAIPATNFSQRLLRIRRADLDRFMNRDKTTSL